MLKNGKSLNKLIRKILQLIGIVSILPGCTDVESENSNIKIDESEHTSVDNLEKPTWYKVGEGNPFDSEILDIRSVTLNIVATTSNKSIAENFNKSRNDDGSQYINKDLENSTRVNSSLSYPHNGVKLEGIVYKADSMDIKWDIYAYGDWFYFVRSWSSDLIYKVHYINNNTELVLDYIISANGHDQPEIVEQNIHSIMQTHVFDRVWPYVIPEHMKDADENKIALYMFSQFGLKATIATYENILKIKLLKK